MNTTDMYSREKANQAHLHDIERETRASRLLREAAASNGPEGRAANRRRLALAGVAAIAALAAVLAVFVLSGLVVL